MNSNFRIRRKMSLRVNPLVFFSCVLILHVFYTPAHGLIFNTNIQSVPSERVSYQDNASPVFSNNQPAIPSSVDSSSNQQLTSSTFPASGSVNASSPSSTIASSSLLPPRVIPNAFTRAVLAIPSLQRFLNVRIPRFEAADLVFNVLLDGFTAAGSPTPATMANIGPPNLAGLDVFTIPLYVHIHGELLEQFLISEGIEIVPSLVQGFANSIEKSLQTSIIDSAESLLRDHLLGFANFLQSIGVILLEKIYIIMLIFNEEIIATVAASKS